MILCVVSRNGPLDAHASAKVPRSVKRRDAPRCGGMPKLRN